MSSDGDAILIVTHGQDDHVAPVVAELDRLGARSVCLDTDTYPGPSAIALRPADASATVALRLAGADGDGEGARTVSERDVGAVWWRHLRIPRASAIEDPEARRLAESELLATVEGALLTLPVYWQNHPAANRLTRSKPLQLALATEHGLTIPDTLISADPTEIRDAFRSWEGQMVAKLVGGQLPFTREQPAHVIHTTRLHRHHLEDDAPLAACPAIYQRLVPKQYDVRATVVEDTVLACRIDSQGSDGGEVDWRRAQPGTAAHRPHTLDAAIERELVALTRRLGLTYAGIDLILTPDGETVFCEINAMGQWRWVEEETGLPIARTIAESLIEGARRPSGRTPPR